jgi:tRNA-splicing ligase RtcB
MSSRCGEWQPGHTGRFERWACSRSRPYGGRRCAISRGGGLTISRGVAGVECRKYVGVLDETPGAYKDIGAVMEAQSDLVEIVHTLKQVVRVKG